MQFCFVDQNVVLVMPVTPSDYQWATGKQMETINISDMGDVFRPGGQSRFAGSFEFLLPAQQYPWMEPGSRADPQYYLDALKGWALSKDPVRFLVTGTDINAMVYVEEVRQSERDGSGDRMVTVTLREQTMLEAVEISTTHRSPAAGPASGNGAGNAAGDSQPYVVVSGDTLSMLCRRWYGNGSARYYNALAAYNGIRNPHLIWPGQTIRIPSERTLLGGTA